jgi:hypothetical protein
MTRDLKHLPKGELYLSICDTIARITTREESEFKSFPEISHSAWSVHTINRDMEQVKNGESIEEYSINPEKIVEPIEYQNKYSFKIIA